MDKSIQQTLILTLLQKYVENRCNERELYILLHWLKSPDNSYDFDFVSESLWDRLGKEYPYSDKKRIEVLNKEVDILWQEMRTKRLQPETKHLARRQFLYRIAAVCLLVISLSAGYFFTRNKEINEHITFTEIIAGRGEIKEHTLSDGSHVILNSESILRVPSNYGQDCRAVEMNGEGFFDVTPDTNKPFLIGNGNMQVKVLGTTFNVKAYPEDQTLGVTVSTGKVLVSIPDIDLQLQVLPMEHLLVNRETNNLSKLLLTENNHTKWIGGTLYFEKEPLNEVLKNIRRKYDCDIVLRCKNCNPLISGSHDNKSLDAVLEAICFTTKLKYRKENERIILYQ